MKFILSFVLIVVFASCFLQGKAAPYDEGADCLCAATANIFYVCGSNGVTYTNPSLLRCAEKCTKQTITKIHDGKCE